VADVVTAASVRVALCTADVGPSGVAVAAGAVAVEDDAPVVDAIAGVVLAAGVSAVGFAVLSPPPSLPDVRLDEDEDDECDAFGFVVALAVALAVAFGLDRAGGRTAGGAPAPNAHPSTDPPLGCVDDAPTVLYSHEPPGAARQYDQ
jgi:hypothetical protein